MANITSPKIIPLLPEEISFFKLTFKPIAAIAMVNTNLPKYSIAKINSGEKEKKDPTNEIIKKPIKYQGNLM